jgi:hypothetical protein
MRLGLGNASSFLGRLKERIPSLYDAFIFSLSTVSGKVKDLLKEV